MWARTGPGAYVCLDQACLDAAIARKAIGRALRTRQMRMISLGFSPRGHCSLTRVRASRNDH